MSKLPATLTKYSFNTCLTHVCRADSKKKPAKKENSRSDKSDKNRVTKKIASK